MTDDILFSEKQRFKQWWFWLFITGINGLFFWGIIQQVIIGIQFGDNPMSNGGLIFSTVLMLIITFSFFSFKLETIIKKEGIYVRFFPFHLKFKYYRWDKIRKAFIRKYNPIREYGGFGIRFGFMGKGQALNVSGNTGLQLELDDNSRLLIGTNLPDQMTEILIKLGKLGEE